MTLDRWIPFKSEGTAVRCRIFCFPHAGGSAATYRPLRRLMPPEIDLCPVQLPGRAGRLNEPPCNSMSALMEQLHRALEPCRTVRFGFFGHSVGSWMAYEAARQLRSSDGRTAVHLFVSSRNSPKRACADPPPARSRSDDDLLAILRRFGGTPAAIMQRPELMAALLPALRADLALGDEYAVDPLDSIACPITAFGAPTTSRMRAPSSPGANSRVEGSGPAFSPAGIFTSRLQQGRSPGRSLKTCMHSWARTRPASDRSH